MADPTPSMYVATPSISANMLAAMMAAAGSHKRSEAAPSPMTIRAMARPAPHSLKLACAPRVALAATAAETPQYSEVGMSGWDTSFALTFKNVNGVIASMWESDASSDAKSIEDSQSDPDMGTMKLSCTVGPWALCGGAGQIVQMTVPIATGSFQVEALPQKTVDLKGTVVKVQFNLNYIPDPVAPATRSLLTADKDHADEAAFVLEPIEFGSPVTPLFGSLIMSALNDWFRTKGLIAFNHIFHVIDVSDEIDQDPAWHFIKPTHVSYAIMEKEISEGVTDIDSSIFAVVTTLGSTAKPTSHQVSPNAIPSGVNCGFNIAGPTFLASMLLTGCAMQFQLPSWVTKTADKNGVPDEATFQKWVSQSFAIENDGLTVTNVADMVFGIFDDDGTSRTLNIRKSQYKVSIVQSYITFSFVDLSYEYSPGIDVHINYSETFTVCLKDAKDPATNAPKKVFWLESHDRSCICNVTKSKAVMWTEILSSIAISIAGAIVGGALGAAAKAAQVGEAAAAGAAGAAEVSMDIGAAVGPRVAGEITAEVAAEAGNVFGRIGEAGAKFGSFLARTWPKLLGAAIGGGVGAAIGMIPSFIVLAATGDFDQLPAFTTFATNAMAAHTWPGAKGSELESIGLHGALQIGLQYSF